ncbi:MAG TPA: polysaccharide deacetylase family protein [Terracidiphilus sp.]|nr:polysaccharide deacetylase family protein [Terracidiphilus sp.]
MKKTEMRLVMGAWVCAAAMATVAAAGAQGAQGAGNAAAPMKLPKLKKRPVVALTFDDLPAAGGLHVGRTRLKTAETLADELRSHHLKGVYGFVNANSLEGDQDVQAALKIWIAKGMKIGNHTFSHPSLTDETAAEYIHDITEDEPALKQFAGKSDWHWFRYPYLCEGDTLAKRNTVRDWLRAHGYRVAQVTLNFNDDDWDDAYGRCLEKHDEAGIAWLKESYLDNAREFLREGRQEELIALGHEIPNVLLLHATDFTTTMLPQLMEILHEDGFRFESLKKVESNAAYRINPNLPSKDGGSLINQILDAHHLPYPLFLPEPQEKLDNLCK